MLRDTGGRILGELGPIIGWLDPGHKRDNVDACEKVITRDGKEVTLERSSEPFLF